MADRYDVAVVGAGPAGATCAALCAAGGLRTLLIERAVFPREKVCGDCLNPSAWPVLDQLGVSERVLALPHSRLGAIQFIALDGRCLQFALPQSLRGEIAVKRSLLDQVLLERARELGAEVYEGATLTAIEPEWTLHTSDAQFQARSVVAADGRNSTLARLVGILPAISRDRVAVQLHFAAPRDFGDRVTMQFHRHGYSGLASVGDNQLNLCLVARPSHLEELKGWAKATFALPPEPAWRTITPLARAPVAPAAGSLLLVGDAARVVEPFTGEGIAYALRSGGLAAEHLLRDDLKGYPAAHRELYRGRLWINRLARFGCEHPRVATWLLKHPRLIEYLTSRVIGLTPAARGDSTV